MKIYDHTYYNDVQRNKSDDGSDDLTRRIRFV